MKVGPITKRMGVETELQTKHCLRRLFAEDCPRTAFFPKGTDG